MVGASSAPPLIGREREIDGPVLLVGHDYGGAVITVAGEQIANAAGLVYVAAFAPDHGENALDLLGRFPGSLLLPALRPATALDPSGKPGIELYIKAEAFSPVLASDLPARTTTALAAAQRPIAADALAERAQGAAWKMLPVWYAVATEDRALPAETQRFMARRAGARPIEPGASHAITLSHPAAIAALIRSAATARSCEQDHGGAEHGHGA
jgi:pimeloyl-ACP methyl ester carboxylesterase